MDKIKPDESRRRTVASKKPPKEVSKKESKSSIASFFFGSKAVLVTNEAPSSSSKASKLEASSKSNRMGIVRVNSSTSISSAISKDSDTSNKSSIKSSVKSSVKGSQVSASVQSQSVQARDDDEILENKTVEISMKLRLWETTAGSSKAKERVQKHKRSLNRDNSTGSNKSNMSNLSNMSALTNNSSISILSRSSSGSLVSAVQGSQQQLPSSQSPRIATFGSAPFDPAAAAAQSRRRFYGETAPSSEEPVLRPAAPVAVKVSSVQPIVVEKRPLSAAQVPEHHSPSAAASHALTAPSSNESTPQSSPKRQTRKVVEAEAEREPQLVTDNAPETQEVSTEVNPAPSLPIPSPLSIPITNPTSTPTPSPSALPPIPKPALKSPQWRQTQQAQPTQHVDVPSLGNPDKQGMEVLPNRAAEMLSARQNWVQRAAACKPVTPRSVQFSSSTKSMSSVGVDVDVDVNVDVGASPQNPEVSESGGEVEDLHIDEATLVEEVEVEEVQVQYAGSFNERPVESDHELEEKESQMERETAKKEVVDVVSTTGQEEESGVVSGNSSTAPATPAEVVLRHVEVEPHSHHTTNTPHDAALLPMPTLHHVTTAAEEDSREQTHEGRDPSLLPLPALHHVAVTPRASPACSPKAEFLAVKLKHTAHTPLDAEVSTSVAPVYASETARASLSDPRVPLEELVRRNRCKQFEGLVQRELEVYLSETEFLKTFRMRRESFYALSQWRQQNQKRSVGLF